MELCTVSLEAHRHGATIYVMGLLGDLASLRASTLIALVPSTTRTVRLDLRAVEYIDPSAFVGLARALNRWRDDSGGRVTIEFPARSRRRAVSAARKPTAQSPAPTDIFDERAARSAAC